MRYKNFKKLNKLFKKNKISSVIHLAAKLSVGESQKKPKKYYLNNVLGTKNIVKCCKENNVKNLIFSSTCAVYKDKLRIVKENSEVYPKSVYGKTKLLGEKLIKSEFKNSKVNYAILRYFNVAGASDSGKIGQISKGDQLFKNLSIASKAVNPKVKVYGQNYNTKDKTCIRDYIHVSDIAKIHILVLKKLIEKKSQLFLIVGMEKVYRFYRRLQNFKNKQRKNLKIKIKGRRKGDMQEIIADNSKIKKFIKWKPKKNSLNKIVKSCIKWGIKTLNNTKNIFNFFELVSAY